MSPKAGSCFLARIKFLRFTERTVTSTARLRQLLAEVRDAGYAIADQQMEVGMRSIAVPVRDATGTVVAGIKVIIQAARGTPREMKSLYLPHLQTAARDLAAQLIP